MRISIGLELYPARENFQGVHVEVLRAHAIEIVVSHQEPM